jgi:hypothetical protein
MLRYRNLPPPAPRLTDPEAFVVTEWYVYDTRESVMRVTYSLMVISIHIKVLNVLSFYASVAFLVKIMEKLVDALSTFLAFFVFMIAMFMMSFRALDVVFNNGDIMQPPGDYTGLGGIGTASFFYTFRMSLGDFDISTFKNLPGPQKHLAFPVFVSCLVVMMLVYVNINVQVIEGVLGEVNERRMEEAY